MSLTIEQLTQIPYLGTRIHSGASGAKNVIVWAHSIELPRPWEWLEAGDLVMTVGFGIPEAPDKQVEYVEQLAAIGASGVAIGADMQAPPLSPEMLKTADRRALPLCFTAYEVPFVQISRAVVAASQPEHARLVGAARIYDQARAAVARNAGAAQLLASLETEIACDLCVCANDTGAVLVGGSTPPGLQLRSVFTEALAARVTAPPGMLRLEYGEKVLLGLPIPARRNASLLAIPRTDVAPPYGLLQHVATLAALDLERLWASREELRRLGAETFAHLIDVPTSATLAAPQLRAHGLDRGPFVVLAASLDGAATRDDDLHHALAERSVPHLLLRRTDLLHALLEHQREALDAFVSLLHPDSRVGVSDPFDGLDGVQVATREARWSLQEARTGDARVVRYGDRTS